MSTFDDANCLEHRLEQSPEQSPEHRLEHCLERRSAQRFEAQHSSLAIHFAGRTVPGFIQNLSGRGMFFYAEAALPAGAVVELTFTMPSEITLTENMPVRCRGRVLRASAAPAGGLQADRSPAGQPQAGQRNGIAVRFDSYQYLPSDEPILHFARVSSASSDATSSGPAAR